MSEFMSKEALDINENVKPVNGDLQNLDGTQSSPTKSNLESLSTRYTPANVENPLRSSNKRVSLSSRPPVSATKSLGERKSSKRKLEEDHTYCQIYDDVTEISETMDFTSVVKSARMENNTAIPPARTSVTTASTTTNDKISNRRLESSLTKCVVKRLRTTILDKMYPSYELYDHDGKLMMVAKKMKLKTTYHFYAADDGKNSCAAPKKGAGSTYLGKLQSGKDSSKIEYSLFNNDADELEIGAVSIDRVSLTQSMTEYVPRKMKLIIPQLDANLAPIGLPKKTVDEDGKESAEQSLLDVVAELERNEKYSENYPIPHNPIIFKSKKPALRNGKFFLNFNGRVKMGSLKNFQLVEEVDDSIHTKNIFCQFGKVSENEFNMDYRHPISSMQALAMCVVQFEL